MTKRLLQIDILKGLLIISVLVMHALPLKLLTDTFHVLYIGQAVPIFIVIFGFNQALSHSRRNFVLASYYFKKISRFLIPFAFAFAISVLAGALFQFLTGETILRINRYLIFGRLPLPGPGNYFISLLFQYTLTIPLLYKIYIRKPGLTFLVSCLSAITFEYLRDQFPPYLRDYGLIFFRYLPAVILGMIIYSNWKERNRSYYFIYLGVIVAFGYQFYSLYVTGNPLMSIYENWSIWYFLSFFYPALLFITGLYLLPSVSDSIVYKGLAAIGKVSYHIFLMQIIYFAFVKMESFPQNYIYVYSPVSIVLCVILGRLLFVLTQKYYRMTVNND